jgi:predicted membrane-bound mannosyltransferase
MKEDKYIEERVGKRNPFLVPEGYFDHLPDQIMQGLPERKKKAKSVWMRPVLYAAASICALLICTGIYFAKPDETQATAMVAPAPQQDATDAAFDEAVDYMMVDNHDIYAYLADY